MYNPLGQLTALSVDSGGILDLAWTYSATQNDGRVQEFRDGAETLTYTYDRLGRLTRAAGNQGWGQTFVYDGFGNRTSVQQDNYGTQTFTVDATTNRLSDTAYAYDGNGNLTAMPNPLGVGSLALAYDQANRLISANSVTTNETYAYNAANQRIRKTINNTAEYYLYGIDGVLLGTYSLSGSTFQRKQTRYWFGSRLLRLRTEGAPAVEESILTDRLGSVVWRGGTRYRYAPYGEERNITAQGKEKFATYYRDDTTLDYAINRYYSSQQARFLSPDPSYAADPAAPQTWNMYAYVDSDPVNMNDPEGLAPCRDFEVFDSYTGKRLGALGSLLSLSSNLGILASAVALESAEDPRNTAEKSLIAATIVNRYWVVNGGVNINVAGRVWGAAYPTNPVPEGSFAPEAFGYASSGFAGIVGFPGQYATFLASAQGDTTAHLSSGNQTRLDGMLNSTQGTLKCENLTASFAAAYFNFGLFTGGYFITDLSGEYLPLSFNSLTSPKASLAFETGIPNTSFGTLNMFYGVQIGPQIQFNQQANIVYSPIYSKRARPGTGRPSGPGRGR